MLFEIDFEDFTCNDYDLLEQLGAKLHSTGIQKYPPFEVYKVELKDFNDLKTLLDTVDFKIGVLSDAVISFDPPSIYLKW